MTGLDLAPVLIETARERARERGLAIDYVVDDCEAMKFEWGREERVRELLGDAFDLEIEEHVSTLTLADGEGYWQLFSTSYGPTRTLADSLDDERREEFTARGSTSSTASTARNGAVEHTREYLLVLGERR